MITLLKTSGLLAHDRAFYVRLMAGYVQAAEAPLPERLALEAQNTAMLNPGRFNIFSRMLLPALSKTAARDAEHAARMRVTCAGLAVEQYRLAHEGAFPESLDDLVPEYLAEVPFDPFTGNALHYQQTTNGWAVCTAPRTANQPQPTFVSPNSNPRTNAICFQLSQRDITN